MNLESNRQDLASRLVDREIYYCVSSLVGTLSKLVQYTPSEVLRDECLSWEEDILPLMESTDYEEALRQYVMDGADLDDLEELIDEDNYWDDFIAEVVKPNLRKVPSTLADHLCEDCHMALQLGAEWATDVTPERQEEVEAAVAGRDDMHYCGDQYDETFSRDACDSCDSPLAGARFTYESPETMDEQDLDDWLDDEPNRWKALREAVMTRLLEGSDLKELVEKYRIDTDDFHSEVYEHWIVSDWLARRLKERGYVVGEVCGLTIWGRQCTGQSICLDRGIQQIAMELWPEEVLQEDVSAGS